MIPLVDLQAQYRRLKPEIEAAVGRVLENAQFVLGPAVESFEREFSSVLQRLPHGRGELGNERAARGLARGGDWSW